ncbi:MAG: flagellar biosynthetic protein FliR [Planctomycetota bacterium]
MERFAAILNDPTLRVLAQTGGLLLARLLPLVVLTPMVGGKLLPRRFRFGVALALVIALLPSFAAGAPPEAIPRGLFVVLLMKEAAIGLCLAFVITLMFDTLDAFGGMVDLARGATLGNVFNPLTQTQSPLSSVFFVQLGVVLFLTVGGLRAVLDGLGHSFTAAPLYAVAPPELFGPASGGAAAAIGLVGELMIVALRLAAPVLVVLLLVDVVLGLINKVAPQIQVFFIGLSVKATLGVAVLLVGMAVTFAVVFEHFARFTDAMRGLTQAGGG